MARRLRFWPSALKHGLLALVLLVAAAAAGQTDAITLQVTDGDGQTWNNGTWQLNGLIPAQSAPGFPFYIAGTASPVPNQSQSGSLSGTGGATFSVTPNASIAPAGSTWSLTVCPQATSACQTVGFTATGSTQTVNVNPAAIRINLTGVPYRVLAYQDLEVSNGPIGSLYYNLTLAAYRTCGSLVCSGGSGWSSVGNSLPTAIAQGEVPVSTGAGTNYAAQTKPVIDVRDLNSGAFDCTGTNDMSSVLTTLTDNATGGAAGTNGKAIQFPADCVVNLANTWTVRNLSGTTIEGLSAAGPNGFAATNVATLKWTGSAGGTMVDMEHVNGVTLQNLHVNGNALAAVGINVDETTTCSGCVTTYNDVLTGLMVSDADNGTGQTNWAGIQFSTVSASDVGDMQVSYTTFYCHNSSSTTSAEILMGSSSNEKNYTIGPHNNISGGCAYGIWKKNGSVTIFNNEYSNNIIASIREDAGVDWTRIVSNNDEEDPQFYTGSTTGSLHFEQNHIAPGSAANTSVYQIDVGNSPRVFFVGNNFDSNSSLTKVVGSSLSNGANNHWVVQGNIWPNATWTPSWVQGSGTQGVSSAFALMPNLYKDIDSSLDLWLANNNNSTGDSQASPEFVFQGRTGNYAASTAYAMQAIPNGSTNSSINSTLVLTQSGFSNAFAAFTPQFTGLTLAQASAPSTPSISTRGTAGSTSYSYEIVAHGGTGTTAASTTGTTSTGNNTLSSTNYNFGSFTSSAGAWSYDVYRTACGGTSSLCTGGNATGKIATIVLPIPSASASSIDPDFINFSDTGLNGDGTTPPSSNTTGQIISTIPTGTAPFSVTSTTPVANLTTVPATYNHSGTQQTAVHIVEDTCTLGTSCSITLSGSAAFTSSTSYQCTATDQTNADAVKFAPSSGTAFALTGNGTDVIGYICVGY